MYKNSTLSDKELNQSDFIIDELEPCLFGKGDIVCTSLLGLMTIIVNLLVIFVYYGTKFLDSNTIYIIGFAVADITSVISIIPQIVIVMFMHCIWIIPWELFVLTFDFSILMNLGLLSAVAIDRMWAIYKPYSYGLSKHRHINAVIIVITLSATESLVLLIARRFIQAIGVVVPLQILICLCIQLFIYPAIVLKLRRQNRNIRPHNSASGNQTRYVNIKGFFYKCINTAPFLTLQSYSTSMFFDCC